MGQPVLLFAVICTLFVCVFPREIYTGLVNKQVVRNIDLSSQLARHSVEITVENAGQKSTQHVYLALQNEFGNKLAFLKVTQGDKDIETKRDESENRDYVLYRSLLKQPLAVGNSVDLKIELVFTHTMTPFPSEITQSERQLVRYNDNHYWYSLYRTDSVKTKVKLSSSSVQSNSELSPSSVKADVVTYGPYKDVAPFSYSPLSLHFENNKPFITVQNVIRWIEVSHWGNIAIEEQYKLQHDGAKLKGSFSRYDFQINAQANGQAAVQFLRQFLPESAADVYYRDDIGNISTSALRPGSPKQTFDMRPRFPLFGAWKTEFTVGYNLPTAPYLATASSDSTKYVLTIPFLADWEAGIAIDTQVLKVVLPEGATDITVNCPFEVESSTDRTVTYLDVVSVGRPVIIITKQNLVNDHNVYFEVQYSFSKSAMFFEPLLLIGSFFAFFVIIILTLRIELYITEEVKVSRVDDEKVVKILENINDIYQNRGLLHQSLSDSLNNYIKSSDEKTWEKEKRQVLSQFADFKKKVALDINELSVKTGTGELVARIQEIEKKQAEKESIQQQLQETLIKYKVKKAVPKADHETEREQLLASYEELENEIDEEVEEYIGGF